MENKKCWVCYNCGAWTDRDNIDENAPYCPDCGERLESGIRDGHTGEPYNSVHSSHSYMRTHTIVGILLAVLGGCGFWIARDGQIMEFIFSMLLLVAGTAILIIGNKITKPKEIKYTYFTPVIKNGK